MRTQRIASLAFFSCLIGLLACSQSGSPLGSAEENPSYDPSMNRDSGGIAAAADPDPEITPRSDSGSPDGALAVTPESREEDKDAAGPVSVVDEILADNPQVNLPDGSESAGSGSGQPDVPVGETAVPGDAPAVPSMPTGPALILETDFESESLSCWNGNRAANGVNRAGCGPYTSIGSAPYALTEGGIARSGSKAIAITYTKNEQAGGANVGFSSDSVNMRAYFYFEPGFDFGQGLKIGRVSSFNASKQMNDIDIILEVRSAKSASQCGVTGMRDVGVFFNGAPKGADWGNVTATMAFERGRWYAVEYQVVLNAPGKSDGAVRLWVDGKQVAERSNLGIRGSLGAGVKLNTAKIGGWYSNGANGNSACADPSQPARLHMDDVAIATSYIGPDRR